MVEDQAQVEEVGEDQQVVDHLVDQVVEDQVQVEEDQVQEEEVVEVREVGHRVDQVEEVVEDQAQVEEGHRVD